MFFFKRDPYSIHCIPFSIMYPYYILLHGSFCIGSSVGPSAPNIGPSRYARDDMSAEGRYEVRYKITHVIIHLSFIYIAIICYFSHD